MRVILAHNFYQQPGGEDQVFADEMALLRSAGHEVHAFTLHNDSVSSYSRVGLALATLWNRRAAAELRRLVRFTGAEVVHFHNTFPLMSPAAYEAARAAGAAVVQTLHNYRLLCPGANFFRDGKPCESCLSKRFAWPAVQHGCYRNSRSATAVAATMLAVHRVRGTWSKGVDAYIALTEFARHKLIEGGLPAERIFTKPNFVAPDPSPGAGSGGYALFVGRLSQEKGVANLLAAWKRLRGAVPLRIVGDGPLADQVRDAAAGDAAIQWLGIQPLEKVHQMLGEAGFLVCASACYEGLPKTIVESFAKGTPVLAPRLGAMAEVVDHGRTGLHFEPGDVASFAEQALILAADAVLRDRMRGEARAEFESKYAAPRNYELLMIIYRHAFAHSAGTVELPEVKPTCEEAPCC